MSDQAVEAVAELPEAKITEEGLAKLRQVIGVELRIGNIFNEFATTDAIRHFADGIGDPNPLWRDEEYARKSSWGGIIAPPNFFHAIFPSWVQHGLPGVHAFHAGGDWTFHKPARPGDRVIPRCYSTGFKEKPSAFAGKLVMQYEHTTWHNQLGELLAETDLWIARTERGAARSTGKYSKFQLPHPWTDAELARIENEVFSEEVRGAKTRYWEDVQVGEDLQPVVKGPFGLTDMVAYCVGATPVQMLAHGLALSNFAKHPAWGFRDPGTYAMEPIYSVHYNKAAANAAGVPFPYDVGVQRHSWLMHLLTNWMGDEGWLKKNYAEYREFVYFSDVVWFKGKVTRKYVDEDGEYAVDIETHGVNQRGADTIPGRCTVILPSREAGTSPVTRRAGRG